MTLDRIGRMSSGGNLVSFVSCYAGGIFAAELATVMHVLDWVLGEKPGLTTKIRTIGEPQRVTEREFAQRSITRSGAGLLAGRWIALFIALRGARQSVCVPDINKCMTQLHCEWTEQVATVCPIAGFTGLLQRSGRSGKTGSANRLRGPA